MSTISTAVDTRFEAHAQRIVDLLGFGQTLCRQTQKQRVGKRLSQEVQSITQGSARLLLSTHNLSSEQQVSFPVSVSFQIQFNNRCYGRLEVAPDAQYPTIPALPLPLAQLLAHICGLLLYSIELSVFIEGQCQRLDLPVPGRLTKREREVLELICQGHNQQTIATMLEIMPATVETYRKRLRGKLGVHSERDIPLAAYQAGLFSILKEYKYN